MGGLGLGVLGSGAGPGGPRLLGLYPSLTLVRIFFMLGPGNMQLSALTPLESLEAFTTTESHLIIDRVRRYQQQAFQH